MHFKSIFLNLHKLFWTVPFICFLFGYYSLHFFYKPETIIMPDLIDKSVIQALQLLSPDKINIRLVNQKEEQHKPEGTILGQIPSAGQMIKPYQTVFLVTSQKSCVTKAPNCASKTYPEMIAWLKENNVPYQLFFLDCAQPPLTFLGQIPQPDELLYQQGMLLYYATEINKNPVIMPSFIGRSFEEIEQFLAPYQIKPTVFHETDMPPKHDCSQCIVKEQRPLPGALIWLKETLLIQLKML